MSAIETCSLCPRLCRAACPVATGAAWEAAVPAQIAGAVLAWRQGRIGEDAVRQAITACVDCGGCQDLCHLHVPLPEALRALRIELATAPAPEPLTPIEAEGEMVALETGRVWSSMLAELRTEPVARWTTTDALGAHARTHDGFAEHLRAVSATAGARTVVTAHDGALDVLREAGVSALALSEVLGVATRACGASEAAGLRCCGGCGPLPVHHPAAAARMAHHWVRRDGPTTGLDARCGDHLRAAGIVGVEDVIDVLLSRVGS